MKITDIEGEYPKITDFENFFDIYEDRRGNNSFNLNETLYLDVPDTEFRTYTCTCECFWPLISYQLYQTTRLTWLLMKINEVDAKNMFTKKMPGDKIRYLPTETINYIVENINGS